MLKKIKVAFSDASMVKKVEVSFSDGSMVKKVEVCDGSIICHLPLIQSFAICHSGSRSASLPFFSITPFLLSALG